MAGQIRITPDVMRDRAGQYDREAEKVGEVVATMDSLLSQLQGEWEGQASQAYAGRFAELRPSFVKAQELISEIAQSLRNAASTLEQTDQAIAAGM